MCGRSGCVGIGNVLQVEPGIKTHTDSVCRLLRRRKKKIRSSQHSLEYILFVHAYPRPSTYLPNTIFTALFSPISALRPYFGQYLLICMFIQLKLLRSLPRRLPHTNFHNGKITSTNLLLGIFKTYATRRLNPTDLAYPHSRADPEGT